MKNLSENHAEVISGFLFACFSLFMASTAHKALIPMPKLAQEHLNFMSLKKKVWNGGMGWYGYGSYPSNRYGPRTCLEPWLLAKASIKSQPLALYENMSFTQPLYKMKAYDHILEPKIAQVSCLKWWPMPRQEKPKHPKPKKNNVFKMMAHGPLWRMPFRMSKMKTYGVCIKWRPMAYCKWCNQGPV